MQGSQIPRSGGQLDVFFDDYQASVRINLLPFVSTVDSVETPRGSRAQRTVEYSFRRIVTVPPGRYACLLHEEGRLSARILIVDDQALEGGRVGRPFVPGNCIGASAVREAVSGRRRELAPFDCPGSLSTWRRRS